MKLSTVVKKVNKFSKTYKKEKSVWLFLGFPFFLGCLFALNQRNMGNHYGYHEFLNRNGKDDKV